MRLTAHRRPLLAVALTFAVAMAVAPSAWGALSLSSNFDSSDEGWKVFQGNAAPVAPVLENGSIEFTDSFGSQAGGFVAPGSWAGDATDNYGGTFSYDLKGDAPFGGASLAVLFAASYSGDADDLLCFVGPDPGTGFTTISHTLDTSDALKTDCTTPAPESQIVNVLSDLGAVQIFGEKRFSPATGEVANLDNVSFGGGGPPPPYEISDRVLSIARERHGTPFIKPFWSLTGTLTSSDDVCNQGRKVVVFRKRGGPDEKLGTRTTSRSGGYRLAYPPKAGTYYAKSPEVTLGLATCLAVISDEIELD